jgi:nucleotide-binding universal stress UspA family protein
MYRRILVPVDGSPTAERGLREAIDLAGPNARLVLLHVIDDYPMLVQMSSMSAFEDLKRARLRLGEDVLASARSKAEEAGVQVDTVLREVVHARAADVIVEEAGKAHCDLIVMGTHGRRGVSRLTLGSEADLVIRTSPVPVLLVRLDSTCAPGSAPSTSDP